MLQHSWVIILYGMKDSVILQPTMQKRNGKFDDYEVN